MDREAEQELVTEQSLTADLRALGVEEGMGVLVHSALSAVGWVSGGPVAVIRALLQAVGADGTLVMPAHSSSWSDPAGWKSPPAPAAWWDPIRATMPAFDPATTPTSSIEPDHRQGDDQVQLVVARQVAPQTGAAADSRAAGSQ